MANLKKIYLRFANLVNLKDYKFFKAKYKVKFTIIRALFFVPIAQLNRAIGCGPVGRGFESLWAHHFCDFI